MPKSLEQERREYQARKRKEDEAAELGAFFQLPQVHNHLIGLWRFHELGKPKMWCATYAVDGKYYDVTQKRTPVGALRGVLNGVRKLKRLDPGLKALAGAFKRL